MLIAGAATRLGEINPQSYLLRLEQSLARPALSPAWCGVRGRRQPRALLRWVRFDSGHKPSTKRIPASTSCISVAGKIPIRWVRRVLFTVAAWDTLITDSLASPVSLR